MAGQDNICLNPVEEPPSFTRREDIPEDERVQVDLGYNVEDPTIISRSDWGAAPPREVVPALYPLTRVFWTVYTGSKGCDSEETCVQVVRQMQKYHMETLGLADIKYNFLIGGDGKVYEGRGWHYRSSKTLPFNPSFYDQRLDIAYIGDYRDCPEGLPFEMTNAAVDLVLFGEKEGYVEYNMALYGTPNVIRAIPKQAAKNPDFV